MIRAAPVVLACFLWPATLAAAGPELPLPAGARMLSDRVNPFDSYRLPTGVFAADALPSRRLEGQVTRRSWLLASDALTTLQILVPLRDALKNDGFDVLFQCEDRICGGFDFRFAIEVIPAPDMHVNIRDFRFLSATRGGEEAVSLLVSRGRNAVHIQMIHVDRALGLVPQTPAPETGPMPDPAGAFLAALTRDGHIVLGDLDFGSGAAALSPGRYASLERLAAYLAATPDVTLALVGHTDSVGALDQNIALSKRRAQSVRARLIETHGVDPARLEAEGMGYLAPVASNLTAAGREANRRVEAVLLPAR